MGSNIQNKFNYQPYNPNIVPKSTASSKINPQAQAQADEEKSNAMKWMVGLTATAAIVIGGLYAAKHGHLGKDAEKFAKKLFGEGGKEGAKEGSSVSPTPTVTPDELPSGGGVDPNLLAFIPLAALRKVVKTPKIKHADVLAELQKLKVDFKFGKLANGEENTSRIILRTGEKDLPTILDFRSDGLLREIRKPFKNSEEIFSYENGILRSIKRHFPTKKAGEFVEQITEFGTTGKKVAKQKFKFKLDDETISIESIEGNPKLFDIKPEGSSASFDVHHLGQRIEDVPEMFHNMRFVSGKTVTTPKIEKISGRKINHITLEGIKSASYVESIIPRDSKYFDQAVQELNLLRAQAHRLDLGDNVDFSKVLRRFAEAHNNKIEESFMQKTVYTPERLAERISALIQGGDKVHAEIFKLILKDIGNMKSVSKETVARMASNYQTVLSTYKITNPEHIATVGKSIKECSFNEFMEVLREVAPKSVQVHASDGFTSASQELETIMSIIKKTSGRTNFNENTKLIDLLKDIADAGEIKPIQEEVITGLDQASNIVPKKGLQGIRKGISRIIKNPNQTKEQILAEMQKIGATVERKADNILEIKTGAKPEDTTRLTFNSDGTLSTIQRPTKEAQEEIFTFKNGVLSNIQRKYKFSPYESATASKKHHLSIVQNVDLNESGRATRNVFNLFQNENALGNPSANIEKYKEGSNIYTSGQGFAWANFFKLRYEELPKSLKTAKIYNPCDIGHFDTAPYITARNAKYFGAKTSDIPVEIPSEELARHNTSKDSKGFTDFVSDIDVARRISYRTNSKYENESAMVQLLEKLIVHRKGITKENLLQEVLEYMEEDIDKAKAIAKLLEQDMGSASDIEGSVLAHAVKSYHNAFRDHRIISEDQFKVIALPLSETSKTDMITILGTRDQVHELLSGCFDDFGKLDVEYMSSLPQFKHVKPEMTIFDIISILKP